MNTKSFCVNHAMRLFGVVLPLTLLLTLASALGNSAGLAIEAAGSKLITTTATTGELAVKPGVIEESDAWFNEAEPETCTDSDSLDMTGDWTVTFGTSPGLTTDASRHWVPSASPTTPSPLPVHFDLIGPGDHGGMKFKGYYVDSFPGAFYGETLYDTRGVQVVQMFFEDNNHPGRSYRLLSGKHQLYRTEPTRVEVLGGWVDVGLCARGTPDASGHIGNFVMVKLGKK